MKLMNDIDKMQEGKTEIQPDVVLILCSSVVYTTRRFMFGLALLFVFLLSF